MDRRHPKGGNDFNAETLALGFGYDPFLSEGAVKPPVFLTSTFQFRSAEEGRRFFEIAYGLRNRRASEIPGLIYSRLNNPNLEIFERRMAAWDRTDSAAVFGSGMAAIATTILSLVNPGEHILSSSPVYGGTHYFFEHVLPRFGIKVHQVAAGSDTAERMREAAAAVGPETVRMLYLETPANPSNRMVDIESISRLARELSDGRARPVLSAVDNTFLGPIFQRPADFGADLVLYSATKFIGGHSDLIAGVVSGSTALIEELRLLRTVMGTMANPFTGWLLLRSLETVSVRMRRQAKSAVALARILAEHPRVNSVWYPSLLEPDDPQRSIFERQCTGPGSLIAFEVEGGRQAAYRVLDSFRVFRLAVSLGGTESLVEHPLTMTHADVPPPELAAMGVTEGLIRMSVGIEHLSDLKRDLRFALDEA